VIGWRYGNMLRDGGVSISVDGFEGLTNMRPLATPDEVSLLTAAGFGRAHQFQQALIHKAEAEIVCALAGPIAERRFLKLPTTGPLRYIEGCPNDPASDLTRVRALLTAIYGVGDHGFAQSLLQERTKRQMRDQRTWAAISEMANKLVQSGRLTPDQAEDIPKKHGVPPTRRLWIAR